jgi:hypothetical protein
MKEQVRLFDNRPVLQIGTDWDATQATADNPHGYLDDNGVSVWRRFDKPACVPLWQALLARAKVAGIQGVLWWQPGGYMPGRPQYEIDSHCIPPDVLPQIKAIAALTKAAGLWSGSLLRPSEIVFPTADRVVGSVRFTTLDDDIKTILQARIDGARLTGIGDAFYVDSFGFTAADIQTAAWLRSVVGTSPLYAEWCNVNVLPWCGAYAEWIQPGQWLHYGPLLDVLKRHQPVIAKDRTGMTFSQLVAWGKTTGVAPLVFGQDF